MILAKNGGKKTDVFQVEKGLKCSKGRTSACFGMQPSSGSHKSNWPILNPAVGVFVQSPLCFFTFQMFTMGSFPDRRVASYVQVLRLRVVLANRCHMAASVLLAAECC